MGRRTTSGLPRRPRNPDDPGRRRTSKLGASTRCGNSAKREALGSDGRLTQTHNAVIVHPCGRAYDLLHMHSLRRGSPAMVGRGCVGPSIPLALGRLRYYMCAQGPWEQQNEPCNATRTMHGAMGKLLRLSRQPPHWPERPCLLAEASSHTYTHTPCAKLKPGWPVHPSSPHCRRRTPTSRTLACPKPATRESHHDALSAYAAVRKRRTHLSLASSTKTMCEAIAGNRAPTGR